MNTDNIKYTATRDSLVVVLDGMSHSVQKGSANYEPLRRALLEERYDDVPKHLTVGKSLQEWAKGEFKIDGNTIFYRGEALPHDINNRIVQMAQQGLDPQPLFNFYERLQRNPSWRSVKQLWSFLQHAGIPLTPEGKFLAYKGVTHDYKDAHTHTVDNSPGAINRMPRNKISDDPKEACHFGFHVGARSYASSFSQRVVICEIDPEHVVCVPYDSNQEKMRVCEYKVIGNEGAPLPSTVAEPDTDPEEFIEQDVDDFDDAEDAKPAEDEDDEAEDGVELELEMEGKDPLEVTHEDADREQAAAEKRAKEKPVPKKTKAERKADRKNRETNPGKRADKRGFSKFSNMTVADLTKQSIEDLRQYAGKGLDIIGASKIPGGKTELIKRILKVRG